MDRLRPTVAQTAAPEVTRHVLLGIVAVGMLLTVPLLALLFRVFKSRNPAVAHQTAQAAD